MCAPGAFPASFPSPLLLCPARGPISQPPVPPPAEARGCFHPTHAGRRMVQRSKPTAWTSFSTSPCRRRDETNRGRPQAPPLPPHEPLGAQPCSTSVPCEYQLPGDCCVRARCVTLLRNPPDSSGEEGSGRKGAGCPKRQETRPRVAVGKGLSSPRVTNPGLQTSPRRGASRRAGKEEPELILPKM